jgi:hypothetical protein
VTVDVHAGTPLVHLTLQCGQLLESCDSDTNRPHNDIISLCSLVFLLNVKTWHLEHIVCVYNRKEGLWPHVREFADRAITYVRAKQAQMIAAGEACELLAIHGHYADAGEVAALMCHTLGTDMVMTGHSLGRNKLEHLIKSGRVAVPVLLP